MERRTLIRTCKKRSAKTLKGEHLWFPLALLLLLSALAVVGVLFLALFLARFFTPLGWKYAIPFTVAVAMFLFAPLWRGMRMLFLHRFLFERSELSLLFYCYSHRNRYWFSVRRCVRSILFTAFFVFLFSAVACVGVYVANEALALGKTHHALIELSIAALLLILVLFLFSLVRENEFLWDAVKLCAPLLSYRQSLAVSAKKIRFERVYLRRFRRSFYPLFLFSIVFLGLPLVFVLPYYACAEAHLAVALIQD